MIYIVSNVVPIAAATLLGLLIGSVYFAAVGSDALVRPRPIWLVLVAIVAEFWLASILAGALIVAPVQANSWTIALGSAIVIWIGFVVPVLAVSYTARSLRPSRLLFDCAHWLIVLVAQAAVLNVMGLVKP